MQRPTKRTLYELPPATCERLITVEEAKGKKLRIIPFSNPPCQRQVEMS
jgi:hypothetical protein